MQKIFRGRGCKSCPVKNCDTSQYRGSRCTALRARYGEDDPENVSKYDIDFRGVHCSGVMWGLEPYVFLFERNGFKYEYEQPRYIGSSADTDHIRIVIGLFLEQLADNALASEDSRREADKRGAPVKIPRMTANITPEELQNAIQDFEDEAYHHTTHPGIRESSKAIALRCMIDRAETESLLPYTEAELLKMHAQPAWCKETKCWGIVCVENDGKWANIPFFVFLDAEYFTSTKSVYNIKERGLTLYRQPLDL